MYSKQNLFFLSEDVVSSQGDTRETWIATKESAVEEHHEDGVLREKRERQKQMEHRSKRSVSHYDIRISLLRTTQIK